MYFPLHVIFLGEWHVCFIFDISGLYFYLRFKTMYGCVCVCCYKSNFYFIYVVSTLPFIFFIWEKEYLS